MILVSELTFRIGFASWDWHWSIPGMPTAVVPCSSSFPCDFLLQGRRERGEALGAAVVLGAGLLLAAVLGLWVSLLAGMELWRVPQVWGQGSVCDPWPGDKGWASKGFHSAFAFPRRCPKDVQAQQTWKVMFFSPKALPPALPGGTGHGQWLHTDKGQSYIDCQEEIHPS